MRHFRLHAFGFTMYLVLALLKVALVNFTFNKYIKMSNSIGTVSYRHLTLPTILRV